MKEKEILEVLRQLARSQGSYGRLLDSIQDLPKHDYRFFIEILESQKFNSPIDLILYLEG